LSRDCSADDNECGPPRSADKGVLWVTRSQVMSNLTDQLETKKKELNEFQVRFNIRVKGDVRSPTVPRWNTILCGAFVMLLTRRVLGACRRG
jgi:hypothetical protein